MPITRTESLFAILMQNNISGSDDQFTAIQMALEVNLYWGAEENEKLFILPFWRAQELVESSPSQQIALKVTNLEDPNLVTAEWISHNPEKPGVDASDDPGGVISHFQNLIRTLRRQLGADPPVALFLVGEDLFPKDSDGNLKQFADHHKLCLVGRIGRTSNNVTVVFIVVGIIDIQIPGSGGPGTTSGARLPPGGED
jgi:hypothetical protein